MNEREDRRLRVLVGVDGSPAARLALEFAVREARLRDAMLVVVMSVELPDYAWIDPYEVNKHPEDATMDRAEHKLRTILSEMDTAGIDVDRVITTAPAPSALVDRSAGAELLVVGSRGHGGFRGLVMGSVSMQCMLHAHCPVAVVRPEPHPEEAVEHPHRTLAETRRQTTATFI